MCWIEKACKEIASFFNQTTICTFRIGQNYIYDVYGMYLCIEVTKITVFIYRILANPMQSNVCRPL
jgi:3-methyladenine DNA glycosylase Mpg